MRLIDRLRGEQRAMQATTWGSWAGEGSETWAGVQVTEKTSVQLLTVYGSARFISDGVSTLPVDTFRQVSRDVSAEVPKPSWLVQPTTDLDRVAWVGQMLTSLLLAGNAYAWKDYDGTENRFRQLVPLDPSMVRVGRLKGEKTFFINGAPASKREVLHIPAMMLPGSDVGLSPVESARQSIGLGLAAQEYGARFFGQGANLSGVIENPGELTPGQAEAWAKAWARKHSGLKKAHLPGVLEGGATWKPTGVTNEQAQFLETRRYTAAEIAGQMFLIDPSELGIGVEGTSLTYANLEQRATRRVQVTYLPWIVRLEMALSALMLAPRFVKFNVNGVLRGDTKTRSESYQIGVRNGYLRRSEIRQFENLPAIDGIDDEPLPAPTGGGNAPTS